MGTTAEKLTYLSGTKDKLKTAINYTGTNITTDTFRSYADKLKLGYIDILNNGTDTLYSNFPKVSGKGSNLSLTPTYEAPMRNLPYGDTLQNGTPSPDNEADIRSVTGRQVITISNSDNTSSNTYEVNLGTIELNKIGNYEDRIYKSNGKWYLEKNIDKIILNGSESYTNVGTVDNNILFRTNAIFNNLPNNYNKYITNYFTTNTASYSTSTIGSYIYNNQFRMRVPSDITNIYNWLSNHNVKIYYVLYVGTTTEITNTSLIEQLEALYTAKSKSGITNISSTSDNLPMILSASALKVE